MPLDPTAPIRIALDTFWYNLLLNAAGLHWGLLRGFVMMGYVIEVINRWLAQNAFAPLIQMTNDTLQVAVGMAFMVALLVLGITYLLAAFIRLEVVNPRSAILWYIAGVMFFTLGPSLYQGMNEFRMAIAEGFYLSALSGVQGSADGAFSSMGQVQSADLPIGAICDHLGVYLPGATAPGRIDGLDVALAYVRADGPDVMGYPQPTYSPGCPTHLLNPLTGAYVSLIPQEWYFPGSFFDVVNSPPLNFNTMSDEARAESIAVASTSQGRLLTAWPLVAFGVVEQLVYLLITIAQGLTFVSFSVAILFAFFKRTEVIANSIVNQWIELIVQTVIIALIQALVVALFLAGTTAGSGMVVLGVGLICLVFMLITLWSGVRAVWNAFNRLFAAFSQAAGGTIISPAQAGSAAVGAGLLAAGGAAVIGSSALAGMSALNSGATPAQAAGLALGGIGSLSSAARTLSYLPGVRSTSLGEAAEQFTEGAVVRRVAGAQIGRLLLTDRDPDAAAYDANGRLVGRPMLVPAVGQGLERWTVPYRSKGKQTPHKTDETLFEDEDGEMLPAVTPLKRKRMGVFTPLAAPDMETQQQTNYADDMRGEELEQHISDTLHGTRTHEQSGALQVNGTADVASVMGDVIRLLGGAGSADHLTVAALMAQALNVTPADDGKPPVRDDLARFGMYADQAARLGLSPDQTERVAREVKESPDRALSPALRSDLIEQSVRAGSGRDDAEHAVQRLELAAHLLPNSIAAYGAMTVPVVTVEPQITVAPVIQIDSTDQKTPRYDSAALSGSETLRGGDR